MDPLFSTQEAAEYLDYHYASVRRLVMRGELRPAGRAGRVLQFRRSELDRYRAQAGRTPKGRRFLPNPPERAPAAGLSAVIEVRAADGWKKIVEAPRFKWEDIADWNEKIRARFGRSVFRVRVMVRDGRRLSLVCQAGFAVRPADGKKRKPLPYLVN